MKQFYSYLFLLVIFYLPSIGQAQDVVYYGHSFRDYKRESPLFDALDAGMISASVDVYGRRNKVKIGRYTPHIKASYRLSSLYLDPLLDYLEQNNGKIYPNQDQPFLLVLNIKSGKAKVIRELSVRLQPLTPYMSYIDESGNFVSKAIMVVISGRHTFLSSKQGVQQYLFTDAHPNNWFEHKNNPYVALVSASLDDFGSVAEIKANSRKKQKMLDWVEAVRNEGKKVRITHVPNDPELWDLLLNLSVDYIAVEAIDDFKEFTDFKY
ncbi:MAG: hypothetical protein LAT68_11025 [Cyclobacteriaceae bacterium]|nr:hypothetical protein [Cyclobacteriaceae bacterium]MCH8516847.1 hypothetical protein [Cyclobacteriaceae bacterium]